MTPPDAASVSYLTDPRAEAGVLVVPQQDDAEVLVKRTQDKDLGHERPDLPCRKVDDRQHQPAFELVQNQHSADVARLLVVLAVAAHAEGAGRDPGELHAQGVRPRLARE